MSLFIYFNYVLALYWYDIININKQGYDLTRKKHGNAVFDVECMRVFACSSYFGIESVAVQDQNFCKFVVAQ